MMAAGEGSCIRLKRLEHGRGMKAPRRMTTGASGCDVAAAVTGDVVLQPGERALIPTGFCLEVPQGFEVQVRPRSGLAVQHGLSVLNAPGTIDADYRGEVKVLLINLGREPCTVSRGDRIAQLVPAPVAASLPFVEAAELSETCRGEGGFGSSGTR